MFGKLEHLICYHFEHSRGLQHHCSKWVFLNCSYTGTVTIDIHTVPSPKVSVEADTTQVMYAGTARNLTCTTTLNNVDDIIVMVDFIWRQGIIIFPTNRISTSSLSQSGNQSSFTSFLIFNPLDNNTDSGEYQCVVTVNSDPTDDYITPVNATNTTSIIVQCEYSYTLIIVVTVRMFVLTQLFLHPLWWSPSMAVYQQGLPSPSHVWWV